MANSVNRNYPLPDPNAVSARADVQNTLDAIIAVDVDVAQLFTDIANAVDQTDIDASVAALKTELQNTAPLTLDQFNELATAINNDPDFYNSIMAVIAGKVSTIDGESPDGSGDVDLSNSYLGKTATAADSSKLGNVAAATVTALIDAKLPLAGGTMTGRLGLDDLGIGVASKSDITSRTDSGFFESGGSGSMANGWPTDNTWQELISATHSNGSNYHAFQLANPHAVQRFFARSTAGNGATSWSELMAVISGSIAANGYLSLSNGFVLQWGKVTISSTSTAITFPMSFPNANLGLFFMPKYIDNVNWSYTAKGVSGATIRTNLNTGDEALYLAIGH